MTDFLLNGERYHASRSGQLTKPPLLLLHGFTGCSENWAAQVPVFNKQFSVISVDILGHGRSASPADSNRYQMNQVAADLIALLDKLQIAQTAVLGYSMGGRLALYLACQFPARFSQLVLESSSPGLATEIERAARRQSDEALADWIEANGIEPFVARWEDLPLWASQQQLSEAVRAKLRQQRRQNSPLGLANSLRGMGTGAQPSLWEKLPALTLPTLLIAGELDSKFAAINQKMVGLLPNGRLHIIPQAGHTTHLERPSEFATAVREFLG
ncbi:MAG: 2-succinyl-6-hydroxy-2,4-cyclohexadiene-1-carboxylate synthase [Ardenticatenaceae bacterium]|nr:2-succinyl-6-hydroxy-2,4-cyclohexadiene-1-carboxylate synthase [Anaerolineales bacterium]MCB8939741.1 2-succinyl-6-hydroxy-2,4-cyclohexadiene-1-carboxylate synthase [Ardenticatenaceae bacterium]MCB8975175.1 2-succinyl-6-hydroxy-2,4-cyclohexadiene-1-carboxylate synthase [Ardenticatenaceae bacterium]